MTSLMDENTERSEVILLNLVKKQRQKKNKKKKQRQRLVNADSNRIN